MKKILIVDDELNMRLVLSAMLKKEGFEVSSAANGREALQILQSTKIAVVITDLKMPDMDGMELLTRISEQTSGNSRHYDYRPRYHRHRRGSFEKRRV